MILNTSMLCTILNINVMNAYFLNKSSAKKDGESIKIKENHGLNDHFLFTSIHCHSFTVTIL